jgi:hypothetical protein
MLRWQVEAAQHEYFCVKMTVFAAGTIGRGTSVWRRSTPGSASKLYEHIIVVDELRGECYGRAK